MQIGLIFPNSTFTYDPIKNVYFTWVRNFQDLSFEEDLAPSFGNEPIK